MKKLLLVLVVVAMASFLFVGCLPGIVDDGDDDGDDDGVVVPAAMTFAKEYTNAGGVTFVPCGDTITVTFPTAVEADYVVYIAERTDVDTYVLPMYTAIPNAGRTIWTLEGYPFAEEECAPICLVALVKHPCCPAVEEILRVVTVDCTAPYADLFVTIEDCADVCDPDPCVVAGAYFTWTSVTAATACDPAVDCCGDDCSGFASWTIEVEPDDCLGPCDLVTGSCPVDGALDCGCLPYADSGETVTYAVKYTLLDNVGNEFTDDWTITLGADSGEIITVVAGDMDGTATLGTAFPVYDGDCE